MTGSFAAAGGHDVRDAVETLARARAYDAPLRRRTEGATWMVWSLVGALALMAGAGEIPWQASFVILTIGWPIVGLLATSAVWRIAALSRPALSPSAQRLAWLALGGCALIAVASASAWIAFERIGSHVFTAATVAALPWGLLALVQWTRMSDEGRRLALVLGAAMTSLTVLFVLLLLPWAGAWARLVMVAIIHGVPFVVGAWHALGR